MEGILNCKQKITESLKLQQNLNFNDLMTNGGNHIDWICFL